jgi:hypothetical protein
MSAALPTRAVRIAEDDEPDIVEPKSRVAKADEG